MTEQTRCRNRLHAVVSLIVCAAMVFTCAFGAEYSVFAAAGKTSGSGGSLTSTKAAYYLDAHELGNDITDNYVYDEELLKGDSLEYNRSLATMSFHLAAATISSEREEDYANKSRNLKAFLEDNGFVDFDTNEWYRKKMTTRSMGVGCAHKKIVDDGKEYTLLVIAPRSAGYLAEWGGNFIMSESAEDTGDHAGFKIAKNIVLDYAKEYIQKYKISGDIKVWLSGYSRGAGVTNQVGAGLLNDPQKYLGSSVTLEPSNLYCYTFGTPNTASAVNGTEGDYNDPKFNYIHNTLEPYDIVTAVPPQSWFNRYGTVTGYKSPEHKERMLSMLSEINPAVYNAYINGGDPDQFTPKTIDMRKLITERKFEIIDDSDPYLPSSQPEFLEMIADALNVAVSGDPNTNGRSYYYTGKYQDALEDFCGYYFSHLENSETLTNGIKNSKFAVPLVGFMYISYMTERYHDTKFDQATIDQINDAIGLLELIIAAIEADGGKAPLDLRAQLLELKGELALSKTWGAAATSSRKITAILYSQVIGEGLTACGLPDEDKALYDRMTSTEESAAMSRILSYLLLYDSAQTEKVISFSNVTQQMKHFATFMGNAASYRRPHNNEVIVSWLKTNDPNYDDFAKETTAQLSGYRRLYIDAADGAKITARVKDEAGNLIARIEDGKVTSRTDGWVGVTNSDDCSWLRLPVDKTYRVELKSDKDTRLALKAAEYSVANDEEVRVVTHDSNYDWSSLGVSADELITCVISGVSGSAYALPSTASYYIERSTAPDDWDKDDTDEDTAKSVLAVKGIARGKNSIKFTWNNVSGAERYVIYMARCNSGGKKYSYKKTKTIKAGSKSWTKNGLKKNSRYKFYAAAQKKVDGKYVDIAKSKSGFAATGNLSGKYTNPKSIKLSKTSFDLAAGKTATIKGKVAKARSGKKLMTGSAALLRYASTDPGIAKVSSKGRITAVKAGSCRIYVQTINGIWKTVKVTVK